MNLEDLKQQENCPLHGKRTPCQSCQDMMNKTYGMETPKEKNYFDTSCQKCGHVPQGERHLCNWETPKENVNETSQSVDINEKITTKEILSRQDLTTPYLVGFKEGKREACKEILGMIEAYIDDNDDGMWACREACDDLSHRIEERYKSE